MDGVARFRRMLEYERWANARTVESIRGAEGGFLAQASRIGAAPGEVEGYYRRALSIMGHIQWTRRVWLSRLGGGLAPAKEDSWTSERLAEEGAEVDLLWARYMDRLKAAELDRVVKYTSGLGRAHEQAAGEILTHAFNHSTYHRGQIAMLVRQCGGEPADTDYILFARETAGSSK